MLAFLNEPAIVVSLGNLGDVNMEHLAALIPEGIRVLFIKSGLESSNPDHMHHPSELNLPLALEASVGIVFGGGVNTAAEVGASGRLSICIPNMLEQTENCKAMQALGISKMIPASYLTSAEQADEIKEALNKLWEFGRQQRLSETAGRCQAEDGLNAFVDRARKL